MTFLKEFFKNPKKTGAFAPSSKNLAKLIIDSANIKHKQCVIELGPGNGIFTEKILKKINPTSTFFSIEINSSFVKATKKRCPKAIVYNDSAENIKKYLKKYNKKNCDCIISSLPWSTFNKRLQTKLLNAIYNSLDMRGVFCTFAYVHTIVLPGGKSLKKLLKSKFRIVKKTKIVWKNLPPAFVYYCEK